MKIKLFNKIMITARKSKFGMSLTRKKCRRKWVEPECVKDGKCKGVPDFELCEGCSYLAPECKECWETNESNWIECAKQRNTCMKEGEKESMENTIEETKVKMAPPWIQYVNQVRAMFEKDPEIKIVYEDEPMILKMYVENGAKAEALFRLLPEEKKFGNVTLWIMVIPANTDVNRASLYRTAFAGNPALEDVSVIDVGSSNPFTYVIFKKEVVQFFNDDLSDAHGNCTTLYQDIAKEIFDNHEGILFCTDNK